MLSVLRPTLVICSVLALLIPTSSLAAPVATTLATFDQDILDYIPPPSPDVDPTVHERWAERLRETYGLVREDDGVFNRADYWNVAIGFIAMEADLELVRMAFLRAAEVDPEGWHLYMEEFPHKFDQLLPEEYEAFMAGTSSQDSRSEVVKLSLADYARDHGLDAELVVLMDALDERDQQYRQNDDFLDDPDAMESQGRLDRMNAGQVDSLRGVHGGYVGRSLVGERYEHVMWEVVQHSNVDLMEAYLPVCHRAVEEDEMPKALLKMLLDRVYTIRTGKQVFGSQAGVDFVDAETKAQVKERYSL